MVVFFALSFSFGALGGELGSSMMSGSSKVTMFPLGALLTRLAKRGFSSLETNPAKQSKYPLATCKWDSENLIVCVVVYT
jgi:hypothetical protein